MSTASPSPADLELAREVARRIVAVGEGRVRRVVMIGSRALGAARADSDLDLVVLVEPPAGGPPWRSGDYAAARRRVQEKLGPTPVRTDLWVRTTDRFEEARRVVGGVEWLIEQEGVEVYSTPLSRRPQVRLSRDQIRRQNVSAWIEHALLAVDGAAGALRSDGPDAAAKAAELGVERAVNAALVAHQVWAARHDGAEGMLKRLEPLDAGLARAVRSALDTGPISFETARSVVGTVVRRLCQDHEMVRYLAGPMERLAKAMILLG